ncbi:MAG: laccase domain-containing protein [Gemmatimonadetes bacterium]|nr:laccase domain-containing protein [Gemmatimonadota bacterium]
MRGLSQPARCLGAVSKPPDRRFESERSRFSGGPSPFPALGDTSASLRPPGPGKGSELGGDRAIRRARAGSQARGRAGAAGVRDRSVTVREECTLCGDGRYSSHRRGDTGRQRGHVGIVPEPWPASPGVDDGSETPRRDKT